MLPPNQKKYKNQYTYKFINIKKIYSKKKNHNKTIKDIFHKFLFLKEKEEKKTITIINFNENKTKIIENESKIFINKRKFKTFLTKWNGKKNTNTKAPQNYQNCIILKALKHQSYMKKKLNKKTKAVTRNIYQTNKILKLNKKY